jgi:hypothetical protein
MTGEARVVRTAARVIVLDRDGRVLLFRGGDPVALTKFGPGSRAGLERAR